LAVLVDVVSRVDLVGPGLLILFLLNVVKVVSVEDHFLDFFLGQETWEKVTAAERIGGAHPGLIIGAESLCISRHLFLEHEEVHDLVEHSEWG
jgi:hypothetical protein